MWLLQTNLSNNTQDAVWTPCNPVFLFINHVRYSGNDYCGQEAAGYIKIRHSLIKSPPGLHPLEEGKLMPIPAVGRLAVIATRKPSLVVLGLFVTVAT
jgi:hypothetical protein